VTAVWGAVLNANGDASGSPSLGEFRFILA
jgi:hypothetical protein